MKSRLRYMAASLLFVSMLLFGCDRSQESKPATEMSDNATTAETPTAQTSTQTADAPTMLDGKRFVVEGGEEGKEKEGSTDTLSFIGGMFHSNACDTWGFGDGAFTASQEGEATMFEATTTSEKEGTIDWKGTIRGNSIEGTYRWTKEGQNPIDYWFRGTMM